MNPDLEFPAPVTARETTPTPGVGSRVSRRRPTLLLGVVLACVLAAGAADAQMVLTPFAYSRGFTLTDFAVGFPHTPGDVIGHAPVGVLYRPNGGVLVQDDWNAVLYALPSHADYQTVGPLTKVYLNGYPSSFAQIQTGGSWRFYAAFFDTLKEIDPFGNTMRNVTQLSATGYLAPFPPAVAGPKSGHLFCSGLRWTGGPYETGGLWEIDPITGFSILVSEQMPHQMAFSADGSLLYYTGNDTLSAFNTSDWSVAWKFRPLTAERFYQGIAVGIGNLDGYLYVTSQGLGFEGRLWEIGIPGGPHAGEETLIADFGSNDLALWTDPDAPCGPGLPSLLITQLDRVQRLDPPGGGWLGGPTSSTAPVMGTTSVPASGESLWSDERISITPNPSIGPMRVEFSLWREGRIHVGVWDIQGREVATLADGEFRAGGHELRWDGGTARGRAPAGIYFARVQVGDRVRSSRFTLVR